MVVLRILSVILALLGMHSRITAQGAAELLSSANLHYTLLVPVNELGSVGIPAELATMINSAGVKQPVRLYIATQKTEVPVPSAQGEQPATTSGTSSQPAAQEEDIEI